MPPLTPNDRQRRILQLSHEWGVEHPPVPPKLTRPQNPPTFRNPADEQAADDLLHRRALEAAQIRPKSGLSRAFSSNNLKRGKNAEPKELVEALSACVADGGSPGVAEALLARLSAAGIDLGSPTARPKSAMLSRRKSMDNFVDRSRLLRTAVENEQVDMLTVLLPHADTVSLDTCLPVAVRKGNARIVELLLRYGASLGQTAEGQDALRQSALIYGRAPVISLILHSDGRPSPQLLSQCLADAVGAGDLETVLHLSRSTADGNYNAAEPLKTAVKTCRHDLALAVIMGNRPPQQPGVNDAFAMLSQNVSMPPGAKLQMVELLLCAGAHGEVVSRALKQAWENQFLDMANLLAAYGASAGGKDTSVLQDAIRREQFTLVRSLMGGSTISPAVASACVRSIPKQSNPEKRAAFLKLLLRAGASGEPLHDALIDAAEAKDISCVTLLLKPYFRERQSNGGDANGDNPNEPLLTRHAVASVDHKRGEALRTAVLRGDTTLTQKLLEGQPSQETLTAVFPSTSSLPPKERYAMVQLFLENAMSGPSLHAALQQALGEKRTARDGALIQLLLDHDADINYKHGEGLRSIIVDMDLQLLQVLLRRASPQTAAARIPDAMAITDHRCRHDTMVLLLKSGAVIGVKDIATALLTTLGESPVDISLLRLLLEAGNADINTLDGSIIKRGVANPDPKVLEMILNLGNPTPESISLAITELGSVPSTEAKTWKLKIILSKSARKEDLSGLLINEVQSLMKNRKRSPSFSTLKELLDSGADPNAYNAAALHHAVRSSDTQITDLLFACKSQPSPTSLGSALPHALHLSDPMDRLTFTKKLVDAGADPVELNRALAYAINTYHDDLSLLGALAGSADTSDGEALGLAVSKEAPDVVNILLSLTKHTVEQRDASVTKALKITDRAVRREICGLLLKAGTSPNLASSALLVAARDGDLELSDILMSRGATISSSNGQPIIEACRSGSAEVLEVLLKANPNTTMATLKRGFQAATEVGDLNKRAVIFEKLLKCGVSGDIVHMQLGSATRFGKDGHEILRILLGAGADPNFKSGDAVVAATSSAFVENLELLLGLWDESKRQKKVSPPTLILALKTSWKLNPDTRFRIIGDLIKAGLPVCEDLHIALNDAVSEEDPESRLIKLLLDHGASPTSNGCKTLIDASHRASGESLGLLLKRDIPSGDLQHVFSQAFAAENVATWFTPRGLEVARSFVEKGVRGTAVSSPLVQVMETNDTADSDLRSQFVDLLLSANPDVNYNRGQPLQLAASKANVAWTSKLLQGHPSVETLSFAFQHIFDTVLSEDDALNLFKLFADYEDGENRIDVTMQKPGTEPILVRAMRQYPRKANILETLLNAGCYHDQMTSYQYHEDLDEPEEMTLLTWAIAQPQKRISPALIEILLDRGANVNVRTSASGTSPLMVAVQTMQPEVVRMLLLQGADVDVSDYRDRTPLSMATAIGSDVGTKMMASLLAAEPSIDDGSLHNAARALNLPAVKVLVQSGHNPDFPSSAHDGRSALGEVCFKASGNLAGGMTSEHETTLQKVMAFLIDSGSDLAVKSHGKGLLHLALESQDALTTTRVLLKVAMWKHINKPFNHYTDGKYTYSPTMYITKLFPSSPTQSQLLALLRANRAQDVFYANEGPQPDDAIGLPEDMAKAERSRRARISRLAEENEDFALTLARRRELASVEKQIQAEKAEMEEARRRRLHGDDLSAVKSRANLENSLDEANFQRKLSQQHRLADQATSHARSAAQQQLEAEDARQRKALEYESRLNTEKVDNARALTQLRLGEREETDRIEKAAEARIKQRLEAQRQVVESQERLARRLASGPMGADQRRQIGFVEEMHQTP